MKYRAIIPACAFLAFSSVAANAQTSTEVPPDTPRVVLPANTIIQVTPVQDITSKHMHKGDIEMLQIANDVVQNGVVVIPRGTPVTAEVTWRTGKGIGGKSAKFELTFESVKVLATQYPLKGKHRQEGRGNTVGALLGSMIITGRSAVMTSGEIVNAFTAAPIPGPIPGQVF